MISCRDCEVGQVSLGAMLEKVYELARWETCDAVCRWRQEGMLAGDARQRSTDRSVKKESDQSIVHLPTEQVKTGIQIERVRRASKDALVTARSRTLWDM